MAETTNRVLALLSLLQTHRQWPGPELARRLDVTPRTLRRDIDRLRELGYTIAAERGAAGGYRLEAGERLPPLLLSDDEAVAVAVGLRIAATRGLIDGEDTSLSALAKFEQVLPAAIRERVNALSHVVETRSPGEPLVAPELLGELAIACRDRERVRFRYTARDGAETDRVVEPHSLVVADRAWYLVAWDVRREDWRTFRVDRIARLFGTRVGFAPRPLPAGDAAQVVRSAMSSGFTSGATLPTGVAAVIRLPEAVLREQFGRWAGAAHAVDDEHTRWPIAPDLPETMLASLVWIPEGVDYTLEGPPEFLAAAREVASRLVRASGAAAPES
jgi:predicted DNA-binding transcriptional regulator YafY